MCWMPECCGSAVTCPSAWRAPRRSERQRGQHEKTIARAVVRIRRAAPIVTHLRGDHGINFRATPLRLARGDRVPQTAPITSGALRLWWSELQIAPQENTYVGLCRGPCSAPVAPASRRRCGHNPAPSESPARRRRHGRARRQAALLRSDCVPRRTPIFCTSSIVSGRRRDSS